MITEIVQSEHIIQDKERFIAEGYKWAIVYHYDALVYTTLEKMEIKPEYLVEARIFAQDKEIYIYREDDGLKAVKRQDDEDSTLETYYLLERSSGFKQIGVKKYVAYDQDGQVYIQYVRPFELIGGDTYGK